MSHRVQAGSILRLAPMGGARRPALVLTPKGLTAHGDPSASSYSTRGGVKNWEDGLVKHETVLTTRTVNR